MYWSYNTNIKIHRVIFGDFDIDLDLDVIRVDVDAVGNTPTPFLTVEGRCLCLFLIVSQLSSVILKLSCLKERMV